MRSGSLALLVVLGATRVAAAAAPTPQPRIAGIEARLLYERTGALSPNILPPAHFSGFNTSVGEGDAKEPANDVLVTVDVAISGDEATIGTPLLITVRGDGKLLARRTISSLYVSKGHARRSLLVPDATCAGKFVIEVGLGQQKKTSQVEFHCGE